MDERTVESAAAHPLGVTVGAAACALGDALLRAADFDYYQARKAAYVRGSGERWGVAREPLPGRGEAGCRVRARPRPGCA